MSPDLAGLQCGPGQFFKKLLGDSDESSPFIIVKTDLLRVTQLANGRDGACTQATGLFSVMGIPKVSGRGAKHPRGERSGLGSAQHVARPRVCSGCALPPEFIPECGGHRQGM